MGRSELERLSREELIELVLSTGTEVSAIMGIENSLIGGFGGRR
ncbi:hypothetical protein [Methylobacterium sp. CM6257]